MAFPYRSFVVLMLTLAAASLASCSSSEISEREGEVDESALADIPEPTVAYACGSFADCEAVEQLRNAQYAVPDVGLVQLVNGRFDVADGRRVEFLDPPSPIASGTLADGTPAIASLISVSTGTRVLVYLSLSTGQGDGVRPVALTYLGDRIQVRSLSITSNQIEIILLTQSEGDLPCCPSVQQRQIYQFEAGALTLVEQVNLSTTTALKSVDQLKASSQQNSKSRLSTSLNRSVAKNERFSLSEAANRWQSKTLMVSALPTAGASVDSDWGDRSPNRSHYRVMARPDEISSIVNDPMGSAIAALSPSATDATYREFVSVHQEGDRQIIIFTQEGLADGKTRSLRYRLEFLPVADQWQMDWMGVQFRCWPERGQQQWSIEDCR